MTNTPNINLPLLKINQSGKEITHNEALIILDALAKNGINDFASSLPENPEIGDSYIIKNATENLSTENNFIAIYNNGWRFLKPSKNMHYYVNGNLTRFDGYVWVNVSSEGGGAFILRNYMSGFELKTNGNEIIMKGGVCANSLNTDYIKRDGASKFFGQNFSKGEGGGIMSSGVVASANATYFIFVAENEEEEVDFFVDDNLSGANVNYRKNIRRIGSLVTNSSGNIVEFITQGSGNELDYIYKSPMDDFGGDATTSSVLCNMTVPENLEVLVNIRYQVQRSSATLSGYVSSPLVNDEIVSYVNRNAFSASGNNSFYGFTGYIKTNLLGQVRKRESVADGGYSRITNYGYREIR